MFIRFQDDSTNKPVTNAATGQLNIYPPVGPKNTPNPPRPPESKGAPAATSNTKTSNAKPPRFSS